MAKSIGTLKASLVLDSKGFLRGFQQSRVAAQSFSDTIGKSMTAAALKVGAAFFTIEKAIGLVKWGVRALIRDFVEFSKESPIINGTVQAFKEFHAEVKAVERSLMEAFSPALTAVFESLAENIRVIKSAFDGFRPLLNEVAGTALYAANVLSAASDLMTAALTQNTAKAAAAAKQISEILAGRGLKLPNRVAVPIAAEAAKASAASRSATEPFRLSPLEAGTQAAAEAILRMNGGTQNTMSKEGVATIEQLKKIEANTRKRGAVIKEGRV